MEGWGPTLAAVNATLNGLAGVCLLLGYRAIRRSDRGAHKKWMVAAFAVSGVFLVSYLIRFGLTGVHRYPGTGALRTVYLIVLGTHTVLATVTPFLAIRTFYLAWKERFEAHKRLSKIAFPIWMYVSVTGVLVYFMLYHWV